MLLAFFTYKSMTYCGAVNEILLWDMCLLGKVFTLALSFSAHVHSTFIFQSACKYDNQIGQAAGGFYSFSLAQ